MNKSNLSKSYKPTTNNNVFDNFNFGQNSNNNNNFNFA